MWDGTENQIEAFAADLPQFFLIRHGATPGNLRRCYIGRTDEPLSKEGAAELLSRRKTGAYPEVELVFCSPMLRCRQTAELIYPGKTPIIIEAWREIDFGLFEGKNHEELDGNPQYQKWIDSNGAMPFPQGEKRKAFVTRCLAGMREAAAVCKQYAEQKRWKSPSRAAAVVHGGTIMALMSSVCGGDYYDYRCGNGEVWELLLEGMR